MLSLASASTSFIAGGRATVSHNAIVKHAGISMAVAEPAAKGKTEVRRARN